MSKLVFRISLFFIFIWIVIPTGIAQHQAGVDQNGLAKKWMDQAISNSDDLSNTQRIALFEKADSLFRIVKNWEYSIYTIGELSKLLQQEKEYKKLDTYSLDALNITASYLEKTSPNFSLAANLRGNVFFSAKADFLRAIPFFEEALNIEKEKGTRIVSLTAYHFNIGTCHQNLGDYDQAITQFQQVLRILKETNNLYHHVTPNTYNELGLCFSHKNQPEDAIKFYEEGLSYAKKIQPEQREVHQTILYLYQNIAALHLKLNKLELAQKYISLALNFQKGKGFIKEAYTYELQGTVHLKTNKQSALSAFQKSYTFAKKEFKEFEKHPQIGTACFHIGNAWLVENQIDSALHYYQLALIHNSTNFNSTDPLQNPPLDAIITPLNAIDILEKKAKSFSQKYKESNSIDDLRHVFSNYELAIKAISKTRQSFNAEGSKHTLSEKVIPVYEGAITTAFTLFQVTKNKDWLKKGFQFVEANKAAALLEAMQDYEAMGTTGIPDNLLDQEYDLKVDIAFYEKMIHETLQEKGKDNSQKIKNLENQLFDFKESYDRLINLFEINYPEYYALKFRQKKTPITELQLQLSNKALIEFFVGEENIYTFVLTNKNIYCEQMIKRDDFEKNIEAMRAAISTAPSSKRIQASLDEFISLSRFHYKNLLEKPLSKLSDEISALIIIPDDRLAYLPFSALLTQAPSKENYSFKKLPYLFKSQGISYNYSAAFWLKHLEKKNTPAEEIFIGYAPEFSTYPKTYNLSSLSCNTIEVDNIGKAFQSKNSRLEEDATLVDFKTTVGDYQIIHLATHTTLDNQNSAFNRIYFSDNYLSQNDLYHLKLNASLVVLSACNTGAGELKKGEGVMSLSRGFIYAGCPSVLMSLWSVDDCTTADIMLAYYEHLKTGKTKENALKIAKEDYLNQTEDRLHAHPYYWAAFVQYGNTEPLKTKPSHWYYYVFGGILFLCFFIFLKRKVIP